MTNRSALPQRHWAPNRNIWERRRAKASGSNWKNLASFPHGFGGNPAAHATGVTNDEQRKANNKKEQSGISRSVLCFS